MQKSPSRNLLISELLFFWTLVFSHAALAQSTALPYPPENKFISPYSLHRMQLFPFTEPEISSPNKVENNSNQISLNNLHGGFIRTHTEFDEQAKWKVIEDRINTFVFASKENVLNYATALIKEPSKLITPDLSSRLVMKNNWLARLLIGIESERFLDFFTADIGIGGSAINQNILTDMNKPIAMTTNDGQTSLHPSALASITWKGCPSCAENKGTSISLQVAADQYPGLNSILFPNDQINMGIDQNWKLSEMVVFNIRF